MTGQPASVQTNTVHVESITMTIAKVSKNYRATATVLIHDHAEAWMTGVVVTGDWYLRGALIRSGASGTTNGNGTVAINSPNTSAKSGDVFRFVVTSVSLTGYSYSSSANVETENSIAVP